MSRAMPSFDVHYEGEPGPVFLAGFAEHGLAGLTAVDYLVDKLDLEQRGHIEPVGMPSITPFETGTPRHHSRLFANSDTPFTVLVGELPIPGYVSEEFATALFEWADRSPVEEVVLCSGVMFAHGPDDHKPFYVATESYQEVRLAESSITAMNSGYLDGVNGSVMRRGLESGRPTCLYTTPAHQQSPDVEAALRLLDAVTMVYDVEIDTEPLETFAKEVEQYYQELAQRVQRAGEEQHPDDRMYM